MDRPKFYFEIPSVPKQHVSFIPITAKCSRHREFTTIRITENFELSICIADHLENIPQLEFNKRVGRRFKAETRFLLYFHI